jgi:hypothetical protein
MQERIAKYQADPSYIKQIIHDGSQRARKTSISSALSRKEMVLP